MSTDPSTNADANPSLSSTGGEGRGEEASSSPRPSDGRGARGEGISSLAPSEGERAGVRGKPSPLAHPMGEGSGVRENPKSIRKQAILLFCVLMFCYAYVHQGLGWNQNSRLDLLRGIFLHGTFKIDADHENTGDKSVHNGHYYSDKAPGIAFLALPAYAVCLGVLKVFDIPVDSPRGWLIQSWITTVGSVGWITALGGVAMFLFLCRLVEPRYAWLTTYVVFLGAAPFPYATMLFSHAAVIGLICIALWAIADDQFMHRMTRRAFPLSASDGERAGVRCDSTQNSKLRTQNSNARHLLAGLCCGLAIASEYTSATAAGGVLALAFLTNWRRGLILALSAIPPLLLIPSYNWACFGGPLAFGYHNLALPAFQKMNEGLFGITWPPKLSAAYLILLSPERGLFLWTPFFLVAVFGIWRLRKLSSPLFWISVLVFTMQVLFISGYYMPNGGAALGPRHLAPVLPFIGVAACIAVTRNPKTSLVLGYYSLLLTGGATILGAMPPEQTTSPLIEFYIPNLAIGEHAPSIGSHLLRFHYLVDQFLIMLFILVPFFGVDWMANRGNNAYAAQITI